MHLSLKRSIQRRTQVGSSISEFGVTFFILMVLILFPLIDLCAVGAGICIVGLCAHQGASAASTQRRYSDSLTSLEESTKSFLEGGFSQFIRLRPVRGYHNTGADLFIDASSYTSNSVQRFGPNQPVPAPLDTASTIYECSVRMTCEVGPLVSFASVPWLDSVPGLGRPAVLSMTASRAAEYPSGLESRSNNLAMKAVPAFDQSPTVSQVVGLNQSGWNFPEIYQQIAAAGQVVLETQVLQVAANNPNWTKTYINVGPGQKLWIDLRSDGLWSTGSGAKSVNANGDGGYIIGGQADYLPGAMLIGKVGSNAAFGVGEQFMNYAPNQTGQFSLLFNDKTGFYSDNTGVQTVRVILTQG